MGGVSPCSSRLVPSGCDFIKWEIGILKKCGSVDFDIIVKICCVRLVAAHVLSGEHASVFMLVRLGSGLVLHGNQFKRNKIKIIKSRLFINLT